MKIPLFPKTLLAIGYLLLVSDARAELAAFWTFDHQDASDSSGHGNNGQPVNDPVFPDDVPPPFKKGRSVEFGGSNRIEVADSVSLRFGDCLTVSFWIKAGQAGDPFGRLLTKGSFPEGPGWQVTREESALRFRIVTDGVERISREVTEIFDDAWHHLAFVLDGRTITAYKDGLPQTSPNVPAPVAYTGDFGNDSPLIIGAREVDGKRPFTGLLDEVAIFHAALTPEQIQALSEGQSPKDAVKE